MRYKRGFQGDKTGLQLRLDGESDTRRTVLLMILNAQPHDNREEYHDSDDSA